MNDAQAETATSGNPAADHKDALSTLREAVATKISNCNTTVIDDVVTRLTKIEIDRRVELLIKLLDIDDKLNGMLKKVKPDNVLYDTNLQPVQSTFTKPAMERYRQLLETVTKVRRALDDMISKGVYGKDVAQLIDKAMKVITSGGKESSNEGEASSTAEG